MSETIGETILPGTYIEVRAEGLIGVSGISTGNVGVVGTANRGPLAEVTVLGSYSEALDTFGSYDRFPDKESDRPSALTLTRTLEQLFKGGASSVYAVRISNTGSTPMASALWTVSSATDVALFTFSANSPGTWGNDIVAQISVGSDGVTLLELVFGRRKERFLGATALELASAVASSQLVTVVAPDVTNNDIAPTQVVKSTTPGGPNGVPVSKTDVAAGLDLLVRQPVNLVVVGGFDAKTIAGTLLAHLEASENEGRERVALVGASSDDPKTIVNADVAAASNPRLVLVAPGIVADDAARTGADTSVDLPPAYTAALVAGKLSTLAPHVSLTNKDVPADDLTIDYDRSKQKLLLMNQVLVVHKELGLRVLKGITTDTGAFRQISVRRIVDYAKAGVRLGSNPYIGKLNNERVRGALKATLDGFLSDMVAREMLTSYKLDVSATRAQEIAGEALVSMMLMPTFSIDVIKVVMTLQ